MFKMGVGRQFRRGPRHIIQQDHIAFFPRIQNLDLPVKLAGVPQVGRREKIELAGVP